MGGMIAQLSTQSPGKDTLADLDFSTTSDPSLPRSTPEAQAALMARPPDANRDAVIAHSLKNRRAYASTRFPFDEKRLGALIGASFDRSYYPQGTMRQWAAILSSPPRTERLKVLKIPSLVLHGSADNLIPPEAGRHTAACIPGAEHHEIEGWGHDLPLGVIPEVQSLFCPSLGRKGARRLKRKAPETKSANKTPRLIWRAGFFDRQVRQRLFDLAFLELHMLAQHGVIFLDREFFRHRAGILLGNIEEAGVAWCCSAGFLQWWVRDDAL